MRKRGGLVESRNMGEEAKRLGVKLLGDVEVEELGEVSKL